jgi:hypothetical protein
MDLTDVYRIFHPTSAQCTFFSADHGTFPKIDHILGHKVSLSKSINIIQHINTNKDKHHLTISIDVEEPIDKIQHHFIIKESRKVGIGGMYLNIIKVRSNYSLVNAKSTGLEF